MVIAMSKYRLAALACLVTLMPLSAWSDCQTHMTSARAMILNAKQTALTGGKLDNQTFMTEFKPIVDQMTQEKCLNELMGIVQFVNTEKQSLGLPSVPAPDTD